MDNGILQSVEPACIAAPLAEGLHGIFVHIPGAGPVAHRGHGNGDALGSVEIHRRPEVLFHDCQGFCFIGSELIEHLGVLGDGIDGGAARNGAHVVGGLALGRDLDGVEGVDEAGKVGDGVAIAEGAVGVAALGIHFDPVAHGAHGPVDAAAGLVIEGHEFLDTFAVVFHDLPAALQIAQALLAGVDHQQYAPVPGRDFLFCDESRRRQQGHHAGGVVADAGAEDLAVPDFQRQFLGVGEDHIAVGHEDGDGLVIVTTDGIHHIQCFIDVDALRAPAFQLLLAIFCPFSLVIGGGGDLRQLQEQVVMLLIMFIRPCGHILGQFHYSASFFLSRRMLRRWMQILAPTMVRFRQ